MEPIRKKIVLVYIISIGVTAVLMLWMLLTGDTSLNWTTIILFSATKFIAGFGLSLTLSSAAIFILTKYSSKFKDNKKRLHLFNWVLLIIIPIVLLVYNFVKIFLTLASGQSEEKWWDNLLFIYGIVSLLISLYIKPTINENLMDAVETTTGDKAKRAVKDLGRGLKKRWFTMRKDYAKATVQDALTLKEVGELTKQRVAVIMLPVISVGSLMFTPIAVICALFFIELLINADLIRKPERGMLIGAMISIAIISALLPFVTELTPFYQEARSYWWILSLVYFLGLLISTLLFIRKLLNMQGYSVLAWNRKRLEERKENLKENQESLEAREKELKTKEKDAEKKKVTEMKKLQEETPKYPDK